MITNQLKKRTSPEMKDCMIDAYSKLTDPNELALKLDEYELIRKNEEKQ